MLVQGSRSHTVKLNKVILRSFLKLQEVNVTFPFENILRLNMIIFPSISDESSLSFHVRLCVNDLWVSIGFL